MDVGYHDYPYDRGEPGYLVMKPGPNPLFERKRRDPPKGEGNSDPSSEPKAEVILPEKSWSLRMQAESGRESDDLSWVNAQISVEWYHTGFWIRQLEFRETLESGNDRLVLQDSGILFDYLLTPRLNVAVGFGVFGIKDLDAKRSLATKIKVDIFPVQPVHYGFDYSHSEIPDTATVRTLQHTLGFNWRNYQPFVSYQKTEIGGTKISGRGFGFRLWL